METPNPTTALSLFSSLPPMSSDEDLYLFLQQSLSKYENKVQLDILVNIFNEILDQETHIQRAILTAWSYLEKTEIYRAQYESLDKFKQVINYSDRLEPLINQSRQNLTRVNTGIATILGQWKINIITDLPEDLRPPKFSQHLTTSLVRLSKITTYDRALTMLRDVAKTRQQTHHVGQRKHKYICKPDVDRCFELVSRHPTELPSSSTRMCSQIPNNTSSAQHPSNLPDTSTRMCSQIPNNTSSAQHPSNLPDTSTRMCSQIPNNTSSAQHPSNLPDTSTRMCSQIPNNTLPPPGSSQRAPSGTLSLRSEDTVTGPGI